MGVFGIFLSPENPVKPHNPVIDSSRCALSHFFSRPRYRPQVTFVMPLARILAGGSRAPDSRAQLGFRQCRAPSRS